MPLHEETPLRLDGFLIASVITVVGICAALAALGTDDQSAPVMPENFRKIELAAASVPHIHPAAVSGVLLSPTPDLASFTLQLYAGVACLTLTDGSKLQAVVTPELEITSSRAMDEYTYVLRQGDFCENL